MQASGAPLVQEHCRHLKLKDNITASFKQLIAIEIEYHIIIAVSIVTGIGMIHHGN